MYQQSKYLFELIRVALGKQACLSSTLLADDWRTLFFEAEKQSVLGICFAGISKLSNEQRPPHDLFFQWLGITSSIHLRNELLNKRTVEVCEKLRSDGFRSCVLKGQGNALSYSIVNPSLSLMRQSGDIDIWIEGDLDTIFDYVENVSPTNEVSEHHIQYHIYKDVEVELHYTPINSINRFVNKKVQKWLMDSRDRQMENTTYIGNSSISIPTIDFNIVYQLLHLHRHFFSEGIGIRHLMDYYILFTNSSLNNEKIKEIQNEVQRFGLNSFASSIMWVLGHVFHFNEEKMLWKPDKNRGRFVLSEVFQMGNFGRKDNRFVIKDRDSHFKRFVSRVKSKGRFVKYFPCEAFLRPIDMVVSYYAQKRIRRKLFIGR